MMALAWEDGEEAVAEEANDFAPGIGHGAGGGVEVVIEIVDVGLATKPFGHLSGIPPSSYRKTDLTNEDQRVRRPPPVIPLQRGVICRHRHARNGPRSPRELGMETETFVGQVGWLLVLGFAVGSLEGDAACLGQIPDQIAPERAVVGPPEEAIGDGRDVVVVGIVDPDTGVTVQVWRQVDESLDPAALGADRLPGHGIECWRMPPL